MPVLLHNRKAISWNRQGSGSDAPVFGEPDLRFVEDLFQAGTTGEGKAIDGHHADFSDRGIGLQRRASAFFVNQRDHRIVSPQDRPANA